MTVNIHSSRALLSIIRTISPKPPAGLPFATSTEPIKLELWQFICLA